MGYVERCLWDFRANMGALSLMREELAGLMSVNAQEYEARTGNSAGDPVADIAHRRMMIERKIQKFERYTRPVERLKEYLEGGDMRTYHMREILRLKYFDHKEMGAVIRKIGISEATYYRRCSELKRLARKYVCEQA